MNKTLRLRTTPTRVGPLAALCLLDLAIRRQVFLTLDDLYELEATVIDLLSELEAGLLGSDDSSKPSAD